MAWTTIGHGELDYEVTGTGPSGGRLSAIATLHGLQRADVEGHSYGGCAAFQFALSNALMAHSLFVLEPGLLSVQVPGYRDSLERSFANGRSPNEKAVTWRIHHEHSRRNHLTYSVFHGRVRRARLVAVGS